MTFDFDFIFAKQTLSIFADFAEKAIFALVVPFGAPWPVVRAASHLHENTPPNGTATRFKVKKPANIFFKKYVALPHFWRQRARPVGVYCVLTATNSSNAL